MGDWSDLAGSKISIYRMKAAKSSKIKENQSKQKFKRVETSDKRK
jgi:hypothetical protein